MVLCECSRIAPVQWDTHTPNGKFIWRRQCSSAFISRAGYLLSIQVSKVSLLSHYSYFMRVSSVIESIAMVFIIIKSVGTDEGLVASPFTLVAWTTAGALLNRLFFDLQQRNYRLIYIVYIYEPSYAKTGFNYRKTGNRIVGHKIVAEKFTRILHKQF